MGFQYLGGKNWAHVTREERFFCQRLYELVRTAPVEFAGYLSTRLELGLDIRGEWEIGYEVCFYRDLWQLRGREGRLYSPKRTFDLCLFGETAIVIIEAKAALGFESAQNQVFHGDIAEVRRLTGLQNVQLVGLCSSKHRLDSSSKATFAHKVVRWSDLAAKFANDEILVRADAVYGEERDLGVLGKNSNIRLPGSALIDAFEGGADWWVGRGGGIEGARFQEDVRSGRWKAQVYEVNTSSSGPPSPNYFSLADFAEAVGSRKLSGAPT